MTAIDFQTLNAALDKDPKYQELMDRVRSYNTERAEYKQKQREALRKIIQFDMLEDLAMDKQFENECISEEYDKAIKENTGSDTEVWSGTSSGSARATAASQPWCWSVILIGYITAAHVDCSGPSRFV